MAVIDLSAPPELQALAVPQGGAKRAPPAGKACFKASGDDAKCKEKCEARGQCVAVCSPRWDFVNGGCFLYYRCVDCDEQVPDDLFPGGLPGSGGLR
jgi:hypothetical protein